MTRIESSEARSAMPDASESPLANPGGTERDRARADDGFGPNFWPERSEPLPVARTTPRRLQERLRDKLEEAEFDIPELISASERVLFRGSLSLSRALGLVFVFAAAFKWMELPPGPAAVMTIVSLATAAVYLSFYLLARNRPELARFANPLAAGMLLLAAGNAIAQMLVRNDPVQAAGVGLAILLAGAFFHSPFWLALTNTLLVVGGTVGAALTTVSARPLLYPVMLVGAALTSFVIHSFRRETLQGFVRQREQDARLLEKLKTALRAARREASERREAEAAQRESEAKWRTVIENAPDLILITDEHGVVRFVSHTHEDRVDAESAIGSNVFDFVEPDSRETLRNAYAQALRELRPVEYEIQVYDRTGSPGWWDGRIGPIRQEGKTTGMLIIARDVNDRRRAEEELRESEARFRRAILDAPVPIMIHSEDGAVLLLSRQWTEITGYGSDELKTVEDWTRLAYGARHTEVLDYIRSLFDLSATTSEGEYRIRTRRGEERIWDFRSGPLGRTRAGRRLVLSMATDVTERRKAEKEKRELEAQVQHAQKLESMGILAGGIAHDFNNLLTSMLGYAELALGELDADHPARDSLDQIQTAALRAADLTNQMLAYSGKGRFVVSLLDLSAAVGEMAHLLEVAISKSIALEYDFARAPVTVEADTAQIRQVIMNLLTNASEAIGDEPGRIVVRTTMAWVDHDMLVGAAVGADLAPGTYALLEVSDNGVGMDEATKARVFDPFFTTKFTGRGLGMAAVLGIVRGHRGAILVDSTPGVGTTVRIVLPPAAAPCPSADDEVVTPETNGHGPGGRILVVDDEPAIRGLAERMLERAGFSVVTRSNGREAIDFLQGPDGDVDAVLLDLTMPVMGGEEALREIQRIRPELKVLVASGYSEEDVSRRFGRFELAGVVQKPFRMPILVDRIRRAIADKAGRQV